MWGKTYNFHIDPKQDEFDRKEEIKCRGRKYSDYKIEATFADEIGTVYWISFLALPFPNRVAN